MHFRILNNDHSDKCSVELLKMDSIEVKRRASQVFHFTDAERFMEAVTGGNKVAIYVGKVKEDDGTEKWKAYHWNPSDPKKDTWGSSASMLPLGTIAWLELATEYELDVLLDTLQKEARKFTGIMVEVDKLSRKIRRVDDENKYANLEQFRFMSTEELEGVVKEMRQEYAKLTEGVNVD